jgi:drug/metabolite transporter (DMT)-like permease
MAGEALRRPACGVLAILAACASITAGNLIGKALLARLEPLSLVLIQLASATLVVWATAIATGRLPRRRDAFRFAVPGVFQPGLVFPLTYAGLAIIPLTVTAFLFAFETAAVLLLAWVFIGERPTGATLAAAAVGAVGVLLMSGVGAEATATQTAGVMLVMGGVVAAALHTVTTRAIAVDADPLPMAAASLLAGLIVVASATQIWPPANWSNFMDVGTLAPVIISGLLLHGAAMIFFNMGLARVDAGTTAILLPSIAPMSAVGGYLLFGERLEGWQMVGAAFSLAAALAVGVLSSRSSKRLA